MNGWMSEWTDGWMDRWMDDQRNGWVDGLMRVDGWMDGWMSDYLTGGASDASCSASSLPLTTPSRGCLCCWLLTSFLVPSLHPYQIFFIFFLRLYIVPCIYLPSTPAAD